MKQLLSALSRPIILIFLTLFAFTIATGFTTHKATAQTFAPSIDGVALSGPSVTLSQNVKIVMDPNEPYAIKRAVQDLQRDIEWILGVRPVIVNTVSELQGASGIIVTYNGESTSAFRDATLAGHENHNVFVRTDGGVNHIVLQGSDLRGTIYAVYTFSDKFLGIPPLWYWSGWQPVKKSSVTIPENGGIHVGTPQTKYRAWFLNNQDLWSGWTPPPGVDKYDVLFETMLRLKLNSYYVGEQVGEYGGGWLEKSQQAQNRGLQLVANNLAQFRQWNKYWTEVRGTTTPALTLANKDKFTEFWKYSLEYAKDKNLDVIWVLGFRGSGDEAFWNAMSDAPTTSTARGDVIEDMTRRQMTAVREVHGTQNDKMAFLIWNELTDLASSNNLQLPQDPDLIWIFGNDIRDHFPRTDARSMPLPSTQPFGYYMNLQFFSTGSHLVEGEGPWKTSQSFKILQARKPGGTLDFGYFNIGNVREFLLTAAVSSEMLWNIEGHNPDQSMQKTLGRYFGTSNATTLTTLYKRMLDTYYQQKANDIPNFTRQYFFHDLRIKEAIDKQLDLIRSKTRNLNPFDNSRLRIDYAYNGTSSQVGAVMKGSQAASSSFKSVATDMQSAKNSLPSSSHAFYLDTFLAPAMFLRDSHIALYNVTRSHFTINSNQAEAYCALKTAKEASTQMRASLQQAAHAPFETWYSQEDLFGLTAIDTEIQQTLSTLPTSSCTTSTPTPTPTNSITPTPTPTRAATPTPTPAQKVQTAYASTTGLSTSSVRDAKRTLFYTKAAMKINQVACYNCGSSTKFVLYNSDSTGRLVSQIIVGQSSGISSLWSYANLTASLSSAKYYVLEFTPTTTPIYYGSSAPSYTDVNFMRYSTAGAPTWKTGSFQIRISYTK